MQLVEDHRIEIGEQKGSVGMAQHQRHLLGRREQHVRRPLALALAAGDGRIAGSRLAADLEAHFLDRRHQVARHVGGQAP